MTCLNTTVKSGNILGTSHRTYCFCLTTHYLIGNNLGTISKTKRVKWLIVQYLTLFLVPGADLFSNQFLADLERIWALRYYIPDPNRPDYSENI